jgi:hypothetical protein
MRRQVISFVREMAKHPRGNLFLNFRWGVVLLEKIEMTITGLIIGQNGIA